MTAFDKTMLPDDINTVEGVFGWASEILYFNYSHLTSDESRGNPVRRVSKTTFFNDSDELSANWQHQVIYRLSLGISANYLLGGQDYKYLQPLGELEIPEAFKPVVEETP